MGNNVDLINVMKDRNSLKMVAVVIVKIIPEEVVMVKIVSQILVMKDIS